MIDVIDIHIRNFYIILICYANLFTSSHTLLEIHFLLEQCLPILAYTDFASALCCLYYADVLDCDACDLGIWGGGDWGGRNCRSGMKMRKS